MFVLSICRSHPLLIIFRSIIRCKLFFMRHKKKWLYKKVAFLIGDKKSGRNKANVKKKEIKIESKTLKRYEILSKKLINNDFLILVEVLSIKSILFEFKNYRDQYPFLFFRKNLVLIVRFYYFSIISFKFNNFNRIVSYLSYRVVISSFFIKMIFFFIFLDSLILIVNLPQETTQTFEFVVANLYILEMVLKMIAFGLFFGENSYFRNKWNFLDFGVVISIYFYRFFNTFINVDFSVLRNLIVLRLIKLSAFQIILDKLFYAMVLLVDTFSIIMILLFISSLVGVQLFVGILRYQCMKINTGIFETNASVCGYRQCPQGNILIKTHIFC